jgi:hypothetical protein
VQPGLGDSPAADVAAEQNEEYVDGFSWRTVAGALFIGLIMMPGAIYLGLIAGQGMGPAAEWVTIILFMEVARRSYQTLKKQEIYLALLHRCGADFTGGRAGFDGWCLRAAHHDAVHRAYTSGARCGHH